jgi:hypothetical protein
MIWKALFIGNYLIDPLHFIVPPTGDTILNTVFRRKWNGNVLQEKQDEI